MPGEEIQMALGAVEQVEGSGRVLYGQIFRDDKWCPVKLTEEEPDLWPLGSIWFFFFFGQMSDFCGWIWVDFGRVLRFGSLWVGFSRGHWTGNHGFHIGAKFSRGFSLYESTSARLFRCEFVSVQSWFVRWKQFFGLFGGFVDCFFFS